MGFKAKKLIGYIRTDRLHRVQAYVEKYGSSITKISLDHRGRNAVHLACRYSSVYCFGYFLKLKPNLMKTDRDGNLPLHWAFTAIKKGRGCAFADIVIPLLKLAPPSQDVPNKSGVTARQLLVEMGLTVDESSQHSRDSVQNSDESDSDSQLDYDDDNDDEFWREKMQDEMQAEYGEEWGRYEQDYDNDNPAESYDRWASRISSEYHRKHDNNNNTDYQHRGCKRTHSGQGRSTWTEADQRAFEEENFLQEELMQKARERDNKFRLIQQKLRFVMKCSKLFDPKNQTEIELCHLPWINCKMDTAEDVIDILLADIDVQNPTAKKKCLREQQVLWHPDKFLQKCGSRLTSWGKDETVAAVNKFSQIINAALNSL